MFPCLNGFIKSLFTFSISLYVSLYMLFSLLIVLVMVFLLVSWFYFHIFSLFSILLFSSLSALACSENIVSAKYFLSFQPQSFLVFLAI